MGKNMDQENNNIFWAVCHWSSIRLLKTGIMVDLCFFIIILNELRKVLHRLE